MAGLRAAAACIALGLSALGLALAGETAGEPPAPTTPPVAPAPAPIPVEEVARRAAEVPNLLRVLVEPLSPSAQIEAIRHRLPDVRQEVDRDLASAATILQGEPTLDTLQAQQQLWQRRQLQTSAWLNALTQRATLLQEALIHVGTMQRTWRLTREAAEASRAPAPILEQIDAALTQIRNAGAPLAAQRTDVLDLQAVVAHEVSRAGTALAQFTEAQNRAIGGVFVRDTAPVWSPEAWAQARALLPGRLRAVVLDRRADIAGYFGDPSSGVLWHVGALGLVALALVGVGRRLRRQTGISEGTSATAVFERPYAATVAMALLVVAAPGSPVPLTVLRLFVVVGLLPVIGLTRLSEDRRLAPVLYALWVLFAVDNLRDFVTGTPLLEQGILILEMLAGIAVVGHALRLEGLRHPASESSATAPRTALRFAGALVLVIFAVALVVGALGYMRLARLLAAGVLGSAVLALTLDAGVLVLAGVAALALRVGPLSRLRMVQHHRDLLERRTHRVLVLSAIAAWVARTLNYVGLFQPALALVGSALAVELGRGSIRISVGNLLEFAFTVWVAYAVSAFIRFVLGEDVYPRTRLTRGISYAISSLLNYVIIALGFVLALGTLGLDLTRVTVLVGAFGVGIGFGLQSVVNNFVSGLILLFERPIHVGDIVEVGNLSGEVVRIGIRASVVRTGRGAEMIVPNAQLVTELVTNWTLSDRTRRIDLPVGVDYGSPPDKVVDVLEAVARAHPQIMQNPAPQAVFIAFGDSAINFELRAWTNRFDRWPKVQTELAAAVYAALPAAGMALPFPQREVRLLRDPAEATAAPVNAAGVSAEVPTPPTSGDRPGGVGVITAAVAPRDPSW